MGRKSSSKGQRPAAPDSSAAERKGLNPFLIGAVFVAVVGAGMFAFWPSGNAVGSSSSSTSTVATNDASPKTPPAVPQATPEAEAAALAAAKLGPHKQAVLPPIPFQGYAPPRSPEVVTAAYQFAAEHPEVASYVPCFCGCQQAGHQGNADCFVRSRAANGDVIAWDEHGVECAVCIDVATRSRQMHASGASVRDIRAAIEKEFLPGSSTMTPTPKPPEHGH